MATIAYGTRSPIRSIRVRTLDRDRHREMWSVTHSDVNTKASARVASDATASAVAVGPAQSFP